MKDILIGVAMGIMLTMGLVLWGACKGELAMPRSHPSLTLISHTDDRDLDLLNPFLFSPVIPQPQPLPPMPTPAFTPPIYLYQQSPCP